MKTHVFGIHVGNSSACLALYKEDGKIEIVTNEIGERVTPAIVSLSNNEKLVGSVAKSLLISNWNCTITNNKQLIDRSLEDSEKLSIQQKSRVNIELVNDELCYSIPIEEKLNNFTPAQIATLIYAKLFQIAKSAVKAEDSDNICCVILVPTYYNPDSISYVKGSVEDAGWKVLQIIKEPSAPILAYSLLDKCVHDAKSSETAVLVYRLGGITCEATLMKINNGMLYILDTSFKKISDTNLLTNLTKYLAQEFYKKYKLDPNESIKSMGKLKQAAQNCMHVLSTLSNTDCFIESLYEGVDFNQSVSRARLESFVNPLLSMYMEPIYDVLKKTGLEAEAIQKVILCGGLLKIPKLQNYVSGIFSQSEILSDISPDEVLAYGAAKQAGYLVGHKNFNSFLKKKEDLPLVQAAEFAEDSVEVVVTCNENNIHCGKYSIIPSCDKVRLEKYLPAEGELQTFTVKVLVEGREKLEGKVTLLSCKDINYKLGIHLTVQKKMEIKLLSHNCDMNEKHSEIIHLKPVF